MLEAGDTTTTDIPSEWIVKRTFAIRQSRAINRSLSKNSVHTLLHVKLSEPLDFNGKCVISRYSQGSFLAMNKGGTMKSLFHPYAKVFFVVRKNRAFYFFL